MGQITCCNVLSDLYAVGVVNCDTLQLLLAMSMDMEESVRQKVSKLIVSGFRDCAREAGLEVTSCEIVLNPWLVVGGVASSVCTPDEHIIPNAAEPGDVLVLTKPLGTQIAVNLYQWMKSKPTTQGAIKWAALSKNVISESEARRAYFTAMKSMATLNRIGAKLLHKYNAHAATDVTGFGILGHAENLAKVQRYDVSFLICNLPIISGMAAVSRTEHASVFQLLKGRSAETSGGLLIALPRTQAAAYCKEFEKITGRPAWIVGVVEAASNFESRGQARIEGTDSKFPEPRIIEYSMNIEELSEESLGNGNSMK